MTEAFKLTFEKNKLGTFIAIRDFTQCKIGKIDTINYFTYVFKPKKNVVFSSGNLKQIADYMDKLE